VLRFSRAFAVVAAVLLAGVVAGCGSSGGAAPSTTQQITTLPKAKTSLVVQNFPSALTGSVVFTINRTQGNPKKAGGWKRHYTVTLDNLVLHLSHVQGKGDQRKASYSLVSADESFTGAEDSTNSKCQTTHIVWAGSPGHKPTGTVEVFSPKFDGEVGFVFLVPQKGKTLTRSCKATSGGKRNTVARTARIEGNANLNLRPSKTPTERFAIGIEIQSSTAGASSTGGYTINGSLTPAAAVSNPVQLCRQTGNVCHPV
jgi:hypothetical protein